MTKKFTWGRVIKTLTLDFDTATLEIVKYHPRKEDGSRITDEINTDVVEYHVEEMRATFPSVEHAVIYWLAYRHLGLNQEQLAEGVCRALGIPDEREI